MRFRLPDPSFLVRRLATLLAVAGLGGFLALSPTVAPAAPPAHWTVYEDLAQDLLQRYLRIDTTNPPGNELRGAEFWQGVFQKEGIETHIFPFAPGRANFVAVLHGDGSARPIVLASHMDVVTSNPARWTAPPFSGIIRDGELYGRGAEDMKNEAVAQAVTMIALEREHIPLRRDIIFLAVGDEEVDDRGAQDMIAHHRDQFRNAEYLITEGGETIRGEDGKVHIVGIDVAEKAPYWIRVSVTGRPGHGSRPIPDSAPNHLVRILGRILNWQTPIHVSPAVAHYLQAVAPQFPSPRREQLQNIRASLRNPEFVHWLTAQEGFNFMVRDTVSLTMMHGSGQTNVIPSEAWAQFDVRLLPGEDPSTFVDELRKVIRDPAVTITHVGNFRPPNSASTDSALYRIMTEVAHQHYPEAVITPSLLSGFTESEMFRRIGIQSYGFCPYGVTEAEADTEHGDNERIGVQELREGQRVLFDVVRRIAAR